MEVREMELDGLEPNWREQRWTVIYLTSIVYL